jgi:hypothetical protein
VHALIVLQRNLDSMIREIEGIFYNDPPIPETVADTVSILSPSDSGELWDHYVSSFNRHFMLLADSEWPARIVATSAPFYCWIDDWNANKIEEFAAELQSQAQTTPSEEVFIFWMREHAVRTVWSTLLDHWINFLYEDEGVLVVTPTQGTAFVFSNGRAWSGPRLNQEAEQVAP